MTHVKSASTAALHLVAGAVLLCTLTLTLFLPAAADDARITALSAHKRASAGDILLVDIRTPQEWRTTGVGEGALAISMHEPGFAEKLAQAAGGDTSRPIALICARGNRSARMAATLFRMGYTQILDVAEGMLGSRHGPGWLKRRLPALPYGD